MEGSLDELLKKTANIQSSITIGEYVKACDDSMKEGALFILEIPLIIAKNNPDGVTNNQDLIKSLEQLKTILHASGMKGLKDKLSKMSDTKTCLLCSGKGENTVFPSLVTATCFVCNGAGFVVVFDWKHDRDKY